MVAPPTLPVNLSIGNASPEIHLVRRPGTPFRVVVRRDRWSPEEEFGVLKDFCGPRPRGPRKSGTHIRAEVLARTPGRDGTSDFRQRHGVVEDDTVALTAHAEARENTW
jgi:hypothetical protein